MDNFGNRPSSKLVPQDRKDEPASVLLEKIEVEKARLIKEKKVKRTKILPPVTPDEVSTDLPTTWTYTRLANIGLINPRNDIKDDTIPLYNENYKK